MTNIAKRADGSWRARYRDARGKEHSRHFERKVDAQNWIDSVTTAVKTGSYVDPKDSRIRFGEWAPRWLATKVNLKATTRATYENLLQNHVLTAWQDIALADINHEAVAAWIADLQTRGLSASTIRQIHRVFSLALDLAVRDGRLARNPSAGAPLPRAVQIEHVYLTHAEVDALATEAGEYRTVVLFLAYTGVRFGELAALRIRHLDLLRRRGCMTQRVWRDSGEPGRRHGLFESSSPEVAQAQQAAVRCREHEVVAGTAGDQGGEVVDEEPWEWHSPGLMILRRAEDCLAVDLGDGFSDRRPPRWRLRPAPM